ncbi:GntR family transcriptional regulator [Halalkalibacter oceani]|uniref:GntR family transcriptional regulator n=1 Tax=Halalkalibacter oceani TaxID=1653776 RepID=UPI003397D62A
MKMESEIGKKPRSEHIYNEIRNAILYGYPGYLPGTLLNENKLADYFGVSKTPAREALNRLRNENLVEVIPYKGYLVSNPTIQDLVEQFQMRLILETAAVELAVQNVSAVQIEELRELTKEDKVYFADDFRLNFRKVNLEFHTKVAQTSGNSLLTNSVRQVLELMQRALFHNFTEDEMELHHQEHRVLIQALEERNKELAVKSIQEQIELSKQRIFNYRNYQS